MKTSTGKTSLKMEHKDFQKDLFIIYVIIYIRNTRFLCGLFMMSLFQDCIAMRGVIPTDKQLGKMWKLSWHNQDTRPAAA
jgi:hypothetical protein